MPNKSAHIEFCTGDEYACWPHYTDLSRPPALTIIIDGMAL